MRSTTEVLDHHLKCFAARHMDGVLADYSADAVFFGPEGALHGPNAIKPVFNKCSPSSLNQVRPLPEGSDELRGNMHTSFGHRKQQTIPTNSPAIPF
jgi:hypothetical protein